MLKTGKQGASRRGALGSIDWVQTLLRGRPRTRRDLAFNQRQSTPQAMWLVIVDASASTRRHQSLTDAKGLLAQVFEQAYRERARVAVMTASGNVPTWHVSGLKASKRLHDWLTTLGAGGGTPLLEALAEAASWLSTRQKRLVNEQQQVLLFTDGRLKEWSTLPRIECPVVLVDIERGPIRLGRAKQMATGLGMDYRHIDELKIV